MKKHIHLGTIFYIKMRTKCLRTQLNAHKLFNRVKIRNKKRNTEVWKTRGIKLVQQLHTVQ